MRSYIVTRGSGGEVGCLVKTSLSRNCLILKQCHFHSNSGFETGYAGSGPADLALSILFDYFGEDPSTAAQKIRLASFFNPTPKKIDKAWRLHQMFKQAFIEPQRIVEGEFYEISGESIDRWLQDSEVAA